jgi:hypothetical protein
MVIARHTPSPDRRGLFHARGGDVHLVSGHNHPELLVPFYSFALVMFFAYCYPIARITIALERRLAVKL